MAQDDQDATQNSTHPHYMPNLHEHIRYPGIELNNYFVTTPVCCPSRTNLWRGQFAHNTNFTDVLPPHGGYAKWKELGIDESYLPIWLQSLGYNTYYTGKFLVDYNIRNYNQTPAGWTDIDALVLPYTFDYNNPGFSRNGAPPNTYPGQYSTDVIADKGVAQLESAVASGKPFYAQISPIAPHISTQISIQLPDNTSGKVGGITVSFYPPLPAPRNWELFSDATLPTGTKNGNLYEEDVSDKPAWIQALPLAQQNNRTYLEEIYRLRLRSLAAVDELVGRVVETLNASGVLDNTYIIYSSDNGYHVGTHRFGAGKVLPYEEDLRVPFLIRGPGIKASKSTKPTNTKVGLHVDFAPTILTLAGAGGQLGDKALDGTPLGLAASDDGTLRADYPRPQHHRNQFQAEFWGSWIDELLHHLPGYVNNTWKAVRVYDEERNGWKYIYSCTGSKEIYDLKKDPGELNNMYDTAPMNVRTRLEALLAVLAVCRGDTCTNPWKVLHPGGEVQSWSDAIKSKYDDVYARIKPFKFVACLGYQVGAQRCTLAPSQICMATRRMALAQKPPPNFVVIFTDDQDAIQNTTHPHYMPNLHKHIRYPGIELNNYFVTTPVCCPSRTNLWRGQFAHNTNFTDVLSPHGGYNKWKALGIDKSYLPVWLQGLGYNTYYVGKFLVDYSTANYNRTPAGWTDIDALLTPYIFDYNNPGFSRNGAEPNIYPGQYTTDVVADKGVAQIKSAVASGKPFYAQISPVAPHTSTQFSTDSQGRQQVYFYPPVPAPRHWELFSDATLPSGTKQGNLYEKDVSDKPAWIQALPLAQQNNRTYLEEIYRLRLRSLAAVDELVGRVVETLNASGVLDNTYIIYSADNGYHVGTHRFGAGKTLAYEEELRVPFLIKGPGIKASKSTKATNTKVGLHVDFAPTILTLAGAGGQLGDKGLDGTPLGLAASDDGTLRADYPRPANHRNQFQGEFWGGWADELLHHIPRYVNNTWKAVRVYDEERNQGWKYIYSCTGSKEIYDLKKDPGELNNLYGKGPTYVRTRLEGLLAVLAVCKEDTCINPWKVLHPGGEVQSWSDAIKSKYDDVYARIKPFKFVACLGYQLHENELSDYRVVSPAPTTPSRRLQRRSLVVDTTTVHVPVTFEAPVERFATPVPQDILNSDVHAWYATEQAKYRLA
ncbi:Arylsulfatase [Tetrabaena socialis]|uniref:Arylsulfatase n=1 Tax=Tetrabaena socialis TaxID=47790 RepID=A0A2J8AEU7_9CHLO|nr:Arylsulfatase [Tetrabaena socialis]|eukprot:PNH11043.1 Arylsulfatase [Tetrabaena socialis]